MKKQWRPETCQVHAGNERTAYGETSESLHLTSGYVYKSAESAAARFAGEEQGYLYSRYGNPTVTMLENRAASFENAESCLGFSSGMAAITWTLLSALNQGDHIVSARGLFGNCRYIVEQFLPRYGIEVTMVDETDVEQWQQAIRENTKVFFCESPTNPTLKIVDLKRVANIAQSCGALFVVDNAFASPAVQQPLKFGADVVVYSATKHIDGQGRCIGGLALGDKDFFDNKLFPNLRNAGPSLSPFNAWILLKGYETLSLRVGAMANNATIIAEQLTHSPVVSNLYYPFQANHPQHELAKAQMMNGGSMLCFDIKDSREQAFAFLNALELILISNNLGDAKSLATHPASTTHSKLSEEDRREIGINQNTIRISVGLENSEDLIDEINQALAKVK